MAAYDTALERWPVPYKCLAVPTRHGETHLIASSDLEAPPLVLLGGVGVIGSLPLSMTDSETALLAKSVHIVREVIDLLP